MFNQSPFNLLAFNESASSSGAIAVASGLEILVEIGDTTATGGTGPVVTVGDVFAGQARRRAELAGVTAIVEGLDVGLELGSITATSAQWPVLEPVSIGAVAEASGFALGIGVGSCRVSSGVSVATLGNSIQIEIGRVSAKGVLNPSDEELILLAMEAMSV